MIRMRLNIAGTGWGLPDDMLRNLASAPPADLVAIVKGFETHVMGRCLSYEYEDGEVWATAEFDETDPAWLALEHKNSHCEAVTGVKDGKLILIAAVLTDAPRGLLNHLFRQHSAANRATR